MKTHMLYWVSTWINWPNYSWYKKEGEVKDGETFFIKWYGHGCPTKTHRSGTHAFSEMEATCQVDSLTLNCFKRETMHVLYAEEWSVVVGGGGSSFLPQTLTRTHWSRQAPRVKRLPLVSHCTALNSSYVSKAWLIIISKQQQEVSKTEE